MNPTDALLWFLDKIPEFRSTVGALVLLRRPPAYGVLRADLERLSDTMIRMRQRVAEVPLALSVPEWIEEEQFDLDYHLRRLAVPGKGRFEDLLEELGPLYATPFDPDRPLWEAYLAEGLADGRGALFVKMHHCLTDGVGGSRLLEPLLAEKRRRRTVRPTRSGAGRSADATALLGRAALHEIGQTLRLGQTVAGCLASAVRHPGAAAEATASGLRAAAGFARELVPSRAHGPHGPARSLSRALATYDMSIADLDRVRGRLGATLNDLLLVVVAGAMHRWHRASGLDVNELRVMVPFNLRESGDATPGNRMGVLSLRLPVGETSVLRRLRLVQERMGTVKRDRRASLYPYLARLMLPLPLVLAERFGHLQTSRTDFVCTNIPGPRRLSFLAGEAIERIYAFIPMVGNHPIAIAAYSYRDVLCVGIDVDPLGVADLERFRDMLRTSYEEVLRVGSRAPLGRAGGRRKVRRGT